MSNRPIRCGLIGYGAWGSHHAQALAKVDGAELAAIAARSPSSQDTAQAAFPGATIYADFLRLLDDDTIDAVAVVLPSNMHYPVAAAALEAGKHVLLEKPMALSIEHCQALVELAARRDKQLAVGHELRLSALWGHVKHMVDQGAVGQPQYVLVELSRRPYRPGSDDWRFDIDRVGSWILEEPIHFFDLARWYLSGGGEPVSLFARANSRQADHPELQDNFSALVNFPGGAYAVITQTLSAFEHHQTVKLTGTDGALWASWSGAMDRTLHPTFSLKYFDGKHVEDMDFDKPTGEVFELEYQAAMFVRAIREGSPVSCSGADGLWSVAMCLAAQESVDRGEVIRLADFVNA